MIVHKTSTEQTASLLTGKKVLANREKVRKKAETFINTVIQPKQAC